MLSIRTVPIALAIIIGLGATAAEAAPTPSTTPTTSGPESSVPTDPSVPNSEPPTAPGVGEASEIAVRLDLLEPDPIIFPMETKPVCELINGFGGKSKARGAGNHEGIDIGATEGQAIYAVETGILYREFSGDASGLGWGLLSHSDVKYRYFHLSRLEPGLAEGDLVDQGQVIGYVGDTGNAAKGGYHLHFEIRPGPEYDAVDPYPLLTVPSDCKDYLKD